ncbi:MAG: tryptophan 2,3-dioxygenase [Planctomycetaceae bacterium]
MSGGAGGNLTYGQYLNLDRLLALQNPPGPDGGARTHLHHDEMLFVVIHQVFELWFKQILHELVLARDLLAAPEVPEPDMPRVVAALGRVHEIQTVLLAQFDVLETMTPLDFLAFRGGLGSASGFQSAQFRELEIVAGLPETLRMEYDGASYERFFGAEALRRFQARRAEPTLRDAMHGWLARTPIESAFVRNYLASLERYVAGQLALHRGNPRLAPEERAAIERRLEVYRADGRDFLEGKDAPVHRACLFILAHRDQPLLHWPNRLLDAICEFEEYFRLWRFRHARMVERLIGLRVGTGGSSGVDYLDATAMRYRLYPELFRARSFLVPRALLPDLENPGRYGFAKDAR